MGATIQMFKSAGARIEPQMFYSMQLTVIIYNVLTIFFADSETLSWQVSQLLCQLVKMMWSFLQQSYRNLDCIHLKIMEN